MSPAPQHQRDPILWCGLIALAFFGVVLIRLGIPHKPFFDEVHYLPPARTLLELSRLLNPEHPPVGKEFIALSITLFGDNPIGWRMMSAIAGTVALFAFMRAMWFASLSRYATLATGVLIATNHQLFVHSRIAMLDIFMVCFTAIALWMCGGAVRKPETGRWRLTLAGISLGIAMGAKWNAVPIAVLPGLTFLAMRAHSAGWRLLTARHAAPVPGITLIEAALWLGVVPVLVYYLTYVPDLYYQTGAMKPGIGGFIEWHQHMVKLQDSVVKPHPYMSVWWEWVVDWRPIWYLYENVDGAQRGVLLLGNPLTMIVGLIALGWCAYAAADGDNRPALALLTLYVLSLGMWVVAAKPVQFYYYYMLPSCFLMGALGLGLERLWRVDSRWRWLSPAVILAACALFAFYYPILSAGALPDKHAYLKWMWLKSWK
ncbi:MAG TPA: phospholipid carrier-dependent glycosyltransferase [Sphingomonadaceae bacterium]